MASNGQSENADEIVSLQEVLEEEDYLSEAAQCVLGNADDEKCSYGQGYVKRQPLYSCLTCEKTLSMGSAGLCLACSLHCHDGHDCVELYSKRNFRCDCGNSKFGGEMKCTLTAEKDELNELNLYNQNFTGVYCTCHRPYPDTENLDNKDDDPMVQCIVCEDWFHTTHANIDEDVDYDELACSSCVKKLPFLRNYSLKKESAEIDGKEQTDDKKAGNEGTNDSQCQKPRLCVDSESDAEKPAYFAGEWRKTLCKCSDCSAFYRQNNCEFLLDDEDTLEFYEKSAKSASNQPSGSAGGSSGSDVDGCMKFLQKFDRVQQVEFIRGFKDMSTELTQFLKKFADDKKVVTESDIYDFFDDLRSKKRMRLNDNDQNAL